MCAGAQGDTAASRLPNNIEILSLCAPAGAHTQNGVSGAGEEGESALLSLFSDCTKKEWLWQVCHSWAGGRQAWGAGHTPPG